MIVTNDMLTTAARLTKGYGAINLETTTEGFMRLIVHNLVYMIDHNGDYILAPKP